MTISRVKFPWPPFFRIFIFFDEIFISVCGTTYLMRDDGATVVNLRSSRVIWSLINPTDLSVQPCTARPSSPRRPTRTPRCRARGAPQRRCVRRCPRRRAARLRGAWSQRPALLLPRSRYSELSGIHRVDIHRRFIERDVFGHSTRTLTLMGVYVYESTV